MSWSQKSICESSFSFRNEELNHICHKIKLTLGDRIMALTDTFHVLWVLCRCANDPRTANDFPNCTANDSRMERMEIYGLKNLDSRIWTVEFIQSFFLTVKLRKPWTRWFDSERFIVCWTNHNKVQDKRKHLERTTYYRYCLRFSFLIFSLLHNTFSLNISGFHVFLSLTAIIQSFDTTTTRRQSEIPRNAFAVCLLFRDLNIQPHAEILCSNL